MVQEKNVVPKYHVVKTLNKYISSIIVILCRMWPWVDVVED
jgi:hypothetical protein